MDHEKHNLAAEIQKTLQTEIEEGRIPPGAQLDERAIAERFGVSRTPVREALRQLAARDLVQIVPRQGIFVSRISITQLRSMLELLGELEALCAKLAARRSDAAQRATLQHALEACLHAAESGNAKNYVSANGEFHEAIYCGSYNAYLAERVRSINRQAQRYRGRMFRETQEIAKSMREHRRIADAILLGDENEAYQAMLAHTPTGTTGFSEFLLRLPPYFFESQAAGE